MPQLFPFVKKKRKKKKKRTKKKKNGQKQREEKLEWKAVKWNFLGTKKNIGAEPFEENCAI